MAKRYNQFWKTRKYCIAYTSSKEKTIIIHPNRLDILSDDDDDLQETCADKKGSRRRRRAEYSKAAAFIHSWGLQYKRNGNHYFKCKNILAINR
ncbi:unnamed protein product [Ceratitis capitata]|uniref:(Mediterranean fruit fly) hypothetical protein n=1 Tax=Ceratitis capitata TaxID=7213 RepID=A0A811UUA3_CERCA|nr:unnamed protein product [Ceratitis capitata]